MAIQRQSATERAKEEMKELKNYLPKNWRQRYFEQFPDYDTRENAKLVDDVFYLRTTDMIILDNIKSLINS